MHPSPRTAQLYPFERGYDDGRYYKESDRAYPQGVRIAGDAENESLEPMTDSQNETYQGNRDVGMLNLSALVDADEQSSERSGGDVDEDEAESLQSRKT